MFFFNLSIISSSFQILIFQFNKLEFVNIILHFYMKSQYDLVQIILMQ